MASTVAMFTGLSGLTANARYLDVIGNNISNVNTTAYKSNRMLFASQFSRNFSLGSVPGENTGGTNPAQIGLGVTIAGTQRNFNTGSISATGDQRDLAIEGDGFFIVQRGNDRFYTRAGAFRQNSTNDLITVSGERVMGYGVDADFNVVTGSLVPMNLPVGQLRLAEATENVRFTGNLNAGGTMPSRGSVTTFPSLTDLSSAAITGATLLTDVDDPTIAGTQALFTAGQSIELRGAEKGGKTIPPATLQVTGTTTVQDLLDFYVQALGIQTTIGNNPDGTTPGAAVVGGVITITGNYGTANDLTIETSDVRILDSSGNFVSSPLTLNKTSTADGESIRTTFLVYDSLGNAVSVDLVMALEQRDSTGTTWRYFLDSPDDTDVDLRIGTGTFQFDTAGRALTVNPITATIDRANTGALTPLSVSFQFSSPTSSVTALASTQSTLAATYQDGTPLGTLSSFSVGQDGTITGAFTNGLTRTIGQVAVASFSNPEGLVDIGSNLFGVGPNSGTPVITTPTNLGTGRVVGGALELSNVDLAQEFINLILASTGYSASSRVITTTDQLLQQLLVLGR
ncbi:MAG: flagellar hook-basal body complex protein [Phycisphaeraceae bacterium]|nr:flagellar hook-basal body complex protein [Phycisphaeraceae bacterium]